MSSRYVRQMFEQWLTSAALGVPYYPTVNQEQSPSDNAWCTATFSSSYREVMTFCNGVTSEDGEVEVIYMGRPGIGYNVLLQLVETDAAVLESMTDPAGKLVIHGRSAPYEFSLGSAKKDYSLSVFFEYSYYE